MFEKNAFDALRRMNPRHSEEFEDAVRNHERVATEIMADTPAEPLSQAAAAAEPQPHHPRRRTPMPRNPRRMFGLSAAGVAVVAAGVIAGAVLLTGGDGVVSPAYAAEAVKKAAVDTSAAAKSGVIETKLAYKFDGGGGDESVNTFSWNGDDVALMTQNDSQRQIRYVDGKYYQTYGYNTPEDNEHLDEWLRCTDYDEGGTDETDVNSAIETPNPVKWLITARHDLAGAGFVELVAGGEGYTQKDNEDGTVTYAGTVTVGALQPPAFEVRDASALGLPVPNYPGFLHYAGLFKMDDPNAPVHVQVTVGPEGLIREFRLDWKLDRPGEESDWSYVATYEQLGSAPEITAPDSDRTVTTDNPFPKEAPGEM